ncbi:zinc finger and BTB domain-containing protein 41-like [Mercenaria mercenaria]|uniref:zinc finger and BTB domain-containing protein 41-like n=1 Tax=Mercenaria mercenaria TaxID=6596 RepID=UPI00234E61EE|nr:zinc finger and BTB domain-containing protein 41-like [Mercenaria mercenaria]
MDIASKNICKEKHYSAIPTLKSLVLPKKGLEYQEKNGHTEVQKGENKSPNKTVESLSKPIDTITKPTSRTFVPREVVVYSAGQISSFVHDFEISEGGISVFSAKQVGKEMSKNVDNFVKQKQIHAGIARSDDSTANGKLNIAENKTIDRVLDKTTKHNIKHFLVTDNNKHHKKENNAFHKDLCVNKHADIKQDCANKTEDVCDPVVNFGTEVINSYQKEADLTRQCSYHIHCDKVLTGENENILSDMLDSSEKLSFLNEHSYSKTLSTNDSQCDQEFNEWKVFYNENYFEDNDQLQIDENTSKGFKELEVEFPDNIIDTETYSKTDSLITANFNEHNVNENSVSNAEVPFVGGNKERSLKASSKGPDRTNEVDLKIPKIGQQSLSVFTRYGFELIQREKFYIQCRFCSQTCSGNEIVRHIDINHVEHPENTNIFQSEFMLLKRFLRDNWSPDSKFFQMELTRGKRYRLYGFSIKPVPELKFICAACKKSFCRNDFIEHVSKCYKKCYKMNTTEEISHQLELLKKISPVFKIKKRKTKDAKLATLLSMKARTYLSKRDMLEEFKSLKPELFKMNNSQFLKEFEEYVEQKKEENKKKQQELISCTVCSKKIKASYMACHMKYAHTSQPYLCAVCGGVYSCERALNSHLHYVHGEKGHFPCSVCGKEFTKENALRQHSYYVHQLQRQFQCYVCGKSFKTRNCLNNHELIHRETRPFSCIVCKATFKRADHLRVHIDKIHDLKVIWVCSFPGCESKYKCKAQLVAHVQRHKGKRLHCSYCPQQYTILRKLNRHMEECHSIKEKLKIGRADIKEMEYGFDGITRLKTLLIHEDELQPEQKEHFKWTDKENSIFMDVMDKYIETKGTAPKSALNKVKKRLKGTKTLKQIKVKLETARCMSRQRCRHVSLSSKKEVKKQLQTQAPLDGLLKVGNGIDFQLSEDVGLESGNSYSIAVEQKDATEHTVSKNGTFDGETK